jgi:hypothetical protein
MTPEEHNKALGICHLAYGGLSALMTVVMLIFGGGFLMLLPDGGPPVGLMMLMLTFFMVVSFILTLPSFIAGYGLLKRKSWARTASIVAAVLEMMSVPIGTAVAVYSFWFMFSDVGKAMYDKNSVHPERPYALHDAPPPPASEWNARTSRERERQYVPPAQPPDWRNE